MRTPMTPEAIRRFWANVDMSGPHWIWRGLHSRDGYGQTRGLRQAHRVSLELARGKPLPRGMLVLHDPKCHRRDCVRPTHLRLGTAKQNAADKRR